MTLKYKHNNQPVASLNVQIIKGSDSLITSESKMKNLKWHKIDKLAAKKLTTITNSPGVVYPLSNELLPEQIKKMTGVSSYYATGYEVPESRTSENLIIGEMVIARSDSDLTKNYNYALAVSSCGEVFFSGPYKGFGHHVSSGNTCEVSSLFGQSPYGKKKF